MMDGAEPRYRRILVKLSGEALMGAKSFGLDGDVLGAIADELKEVCKLDIELSIVIGGGNIFRGLAASAKGMDRATGDYMGMLATVMNGLALQDVVAWDSEVRPGNNLPLTLFWRAGDKWVETEGLSYRLEVITNKTKSLYEHGAAQDNNSTLDDQAITIHIWLLFEPGRVLVQAASETVYQTVMHYQQFIAYAAQKMTIV